MYKTVDQTGNELAVYYVKVTTTNKSVVQDKCIITMSQLSL